MYYWITIILGLVVVLQTTFGYLGPEGCELGWKYYKNNCYNFVEGNTHFDSAKSICGTVKGGTLVTLWRQDETDFITNTLKQLKTGSSWIGLVPTKDRWTWMDGAFFDSGNNDIPAANEDLCGYVTPGGNIRTVDCDTVKPAFVCKKPLEMLYGPSDMNITDDLVTLEMDQSATVFERLWPPRLHRGLMDESQSYLLATVDVAHETDCAYRCYTIDDCRAFIIKCKASRKCNTFTCILLSGIHQT